MWKQETTNSGTLRFFWMKSALQIKWIIIIIIITKDDILTCDWYTCEILRRPSNTNIYRHYRCTTVKCCYRFYCCITFGVICSYWDNRLWIKSTPVWECATFFTSYVTDQLRIMRWLYNTRITPFLAQDTGRKTERHDTDAERQNALCRK